MLPNSAPWLRAEARRQLQMETENVFGLKIADIPLSPEERRLTAQSPCALFTGSEPKVVGRRRRFVVGMRRNHNMDLPFHWGRNSFVSSNNQHQVQDLL